MPSIRKVPLVTGEYYHIFNRGIDKRPTFTDLNEFSRAFQIMNYYKSSSPPVKLSIFLRRGENKREELNQEPWGEKLVSIVAYCFMPNHFHFLLKQEVDWGISKYLSQFLNSYTRYFNTKHERVGQLFLDQFKNVLVESEEQFLHLARYIHLNPYSSGVIRSLEDIEKYEWSSLKEYLGKDEQNICNKEIVYNCFKSTNSYKEFVLNHADYQRNLEIIKHLMLED